MYRLTIDKQKCTGCGACEKTLPGFRTAYRCELLISDKMMGEEEVKAATDHAISNCENGAILLEYVC